MKILLSGYGRMGKEVEKQAIARRHTIVGKLNKPSDWDQEAPFRLADAIIDFSLPETAIANIYNAFDKKVPIVTGTTGWYDNIDEVISKCREQNQTLFYAPNFNIGVNLFFEINRALAKHMNDQEMYEVAISETHHIHKKDAPSGTARHLAEDIIKSVARYNGWSDSPSQTGKIPVTSIREGEVPGTHEVTYNSEFDTITLTHEAKSRIGFALGAVKAAEWVLGKKGVFTMNDLLFNKF